MTIYRLDPKRSGELARTLSRTVGREPRILPPLRRIFFDTFDWAVFRSDGILEAVTEPRNGSPLCLLWTDRGGQWRHVARVRRPPAFAADLAPGSFKDELVRITGGRRLLPLVDVVGRKREWIVAEGNAQPVARVTLTNATARAQTTEAERPVATTLRVHPLGEARDPLSHTLDQLTDVLALAESRQSDLEAALEAVGRAPDDYQTAVDVPLEPASRADVSLLVILRLLCGTMLRNEDGVLRDLDPEFLHDFRVACRRTRTALGGVRDVLPPETAARFRREFRALHRATSELRDLDVYRLQLPGYRSALAPDLRARLDPLAAHLERRRRAEHERLATVLEGPWYRHVMGDWRVFVLTLPDPSDGGPRAGRPVAEVARGAVGRAYQRVARTESEPSGGGTSVEMHRLRIECKKLRYLIEFFRSLFPRDVIEPAVEDLKQIQDVLGEFNDLEIERHGLRRFALEMADQGDTPPETLVVIGQLIEHLRHRQRAAQARFDELFQQFLRPASRRRFERLSGDA